MNKMLIFFILLIPVQSWSEEIVILQPEPSAGRFNKILSNRINVRMKKNYSQTNFQKYLQSLNARISEPFLLPEQTISCNSNLMQNYPVFSKEKISRMIAAEEPLLRTFEIVYTGTESPEKFCQMLLRNCPDIEIAEPCVVDEMAGTFIPNDPKVSQQGLLLKIGAFQAWSDFKGDTSVIIGISDNGVFQTHEDLAPAIATNWGEIPDNGIDDDKNGFIDDYQGYNLTYISDGRKPGNTNNPSSSHGTNCAGIASAKTNNGIGMAGIGFNCRLFPIKAAPYNATTLNAGYKSILYAAIRGCKVISCSWGTVNKAYSGVDQSILDFAISRDLAIVTAGGNTRFDIKDRTDIYLPAGYFGCLGVGEVNNNDEITDNSMIGSAVRVMAQGGGNVATNNSNDYEIVSGGTSFAAPVVAGMVAFIRARYPLLNCIQALEFTRQCTDDITSKNTEWKDLITGRINLKTAMDVDPFSIPAIYPLSMVLKTSRGFITERFLQGDTVLLEINTHNYLGQANNLRFVCRNVYDPDNTVFILDSVVNESTIGKDSDYLLRTFKFLQNAVTSKRIFFRIDIYGENNYHDFFLLPYISQTEVTTFANNTIKFSVNDNGTFATANSSNNFKGVGFLFKNFRNQLYRSGLMASENAAKVVSTLFSNGSSTLPNDFAVIKPLVVPNENISILEDSRAAFDIKIGLRIEQKFIVPPDNKSIAGINLKVQNISGKTLKDLSVGYYFDWDIGYDTDSNKVRLFPEAIPETFTPIAAAAEIQEYPGGNFPVFGSAVCHPDANYEAQAAGLSYDMTKNFSTENQIAALNTGTAIQYSKIGDCSYVIGLRFLGNMTPNQEYLFKICFGGADSVAGLASGLMECITSGLNVNENESSAQFDVKIFPQPADEYLLIETERTLFSSIEIQITDILGNPVKSIIIAENSNNLNSRLIDLSNLSTGKYFVRIRGGKNILVKPLVVIH